MMNKKINKITSKMQKFSKEELLSKIGKRWVMRIKNQW